MDDNKAYVQDLRICTVKSEPSEPVDRQFCFELVTPSRTYVLQAETEEEKEAWVHAIQEGIREALHKNIAVRHHRTITSGLGGSDSGVTAISITSRQQ